MVDQLLKDWDTCLKIKLKKPSPRPVVSIPLATEFKEKVAMNTKFIWSQIELHIIDHWPYK